MQYLRTLLLVPALLGSAAGARVISATPQGFEVSETVAIAAPPAQVYAALGKVGSWWDPAHSYSGSAANLTLSLEAGGCFCERTAAGGAVEHLRVVHVQPGQVLRLRGGLGPVQMEGAEGAFTWSLKPAAGGTELTQSYVVGGYLRGGPEKLAPAVDMVLSAQLRRLKHFVETGVPKAAKAR